MKRVAKKTFWICTLLLLVGLTCRLLWQASRTETGLETLRLQWRDATWGLVVGKRTPIHSEDPTVQARQWLDEIDRVLHSERCDAESTMGAALVLDSPSAGYKIRYLKRIDTLRTFTSLAWSTDGLKAAEDDFEAQCKEECLALAAKATELDPTNVEWWRLRALLLWREATYSFDDAPRVNHWLEILEEASQHDADNALYDYLAAHFYWASAEVEFFEMDLSGTDARLVVQDAERFNRGISHFEQGQKKPYFAVGDAGFSAVAEFLSDTAIPITDHDKIIESRLIHARRASLLLSVWQWQDSRASEVEAGDIQKALAMRRKNLRLIDQFTGASASTKYDSIAIAVRSATAYRINTLVNEHKELFPAAEIDDARALEESARLTSKVVKSALKLVKNGPQRQAGTVITGSPTTVICALFVEISPSLVVILMLVGFLAIGFSRIGRDRDLPRIGAIGHSLSLAAAFLYSVVVFGLAPSKIIPPSIQAWVLTTLVIASPIVLASWVGWSWLRRRAFKFSLRAMLTCMFALSVLFGVVVSTSPSARSFAQLPFDLSIPARGWEGVDGESLERVLLPLGSGLWAVLQWTAYYGQYLTLGAWAAIAALLLRFKLRRLHARTGGLAPTFPNFLGAWIGSLGRAFLALSALVTILYLSFAPAVVARAEREFQDKMTFARQPSDHWSEVERAVQHVRSNQKRVEQLRAAAKAEIAEQRLFESRERGWAYRNLPVA